MSGKRDDSNMDQSIIPDASKLSEEKHAFESQSTISDYGYSSGYINSEDIKEEEQVEDPQAPPSATVLEPKQQEEQEDSMRLESGIGLSESFSDLNIHPDKLNDLSSSKVSITERPTPTSTTKQEDSWNVYFQQDEDGNTALHYAIAQGFREPVQSLIKRAPRPLLLDTPNDNAQSPIHVAVAKGCAQIVRWLVVAGAKPCPRNIRGDSPLHLAARSNNLECCKAITRQVQKEERWNMELSYTDVTSYQTNLDQWNYEGQTAVHVAAIEGNVEVLRHLLTEGADVNARDGRQGYTALHYAIESRNERLLHFLLTECHTLNPLAVTYGGKGALQLGCDVSAHIAQALRSRGVESPFTSDDDDEDDDSESESELYENSNNLYCHNLVEMSA